MDFDRFFGLLKALEREAVDYILVGGIALNLHGIVRATEDIDLFVRANADNVDRLKRALRSVWNDPDIAQIRLEDLAGDYPTVRYGPPDEGFVIDLIGRLGSAVTFDDLKADVADVEGVRVRLASPESLYRMKKDTVRAQDRADAQLLKDRFGLKED